MQNIKDVYGEDTPDNIIENFAKINAYDFTYKPEAVEEYKDDPNVKGVDEKEHVGVIAQELEQNPITKGTVSTSDKGDKVVDIEHLAFADTAVIAELSRRVLALEKAIGLADKQE